MNLLGAALGIAILLLIALQAVLVFSYLPVLLRGTRPQRPADADCPRVAVILCLRGVDPFLEQTLRQLLAQDYPNFDIRIVLDSQLDPAWALVQSVISSSSATNIHIELLEKPRDAWSLKCSSLVQTVNRLDDSYEVVALLDADTVPHVTWLRELVAPLANPGVGAATGNRWYMPHEASWGAVIRYLWNAAAVVQMYWYRIAWGGTLAIKLKALRESELLDRWGHAFCEDTMTFSALRKLGLRVQFVPSLLMVNREDCTLDGFFRWVRRQLLAARLYHPGWLAVVAHGIGVVVVLLAALATAVVALATQHFNAALGIALAMLVYFVTAYIFSVCLERAAAKVVAARGEPSQWLTARAMWRCWWGLPAAHLLHASAMLTAIMVRQVDWRGIHYKIGGPWQVKLVSYQPYCPTAAGAEAGKSL